MPISLRPDRGDVPPLGDPAYDALLAWTLRPEEAVASLRLVAESFAALYAAPAHTGPAAETSAMTAFRALAAAGRGTAAARPGPGRWVRSRLVSIRIGLAAAAIALTAGSAAAAYAGDLPAPMQRVAHAVIGAPPAPQGVPHPAPDRPAAAPIPGNAAYGLCRAYQRALAQSHPAHNPVTFRRLATAAGGASRVTAYCARLVHPGNPANGHPAHPQHGKPSTLPTHHGRPSWAASQHGRPTG